MDCLDRILVRQHINQTTIGMKTWRRKVTLHLYRLLWLTQHLSKKEWVKKKVKEADEILTKKNVKIPCRSCTNRQKRHFYSWRQTDSNLAGKLGDLAFILFRLKRVLVDFFYFLLYTSNLTTIFFAKFFANEKEMHERNHYRNAFVHETSCRVIWRHEKTDRRLENITYYTVYKKNFFLENG